MTHRLFPREATDDEIAIEVIASLLGVTIEEAAQILGEEGGTPLGELMGANPVEDSNA